MNTNVKSIIASIRGFFRSDDLREALQNTQQQTMHATLPAVVEGLAFEKKVDLKENEFIAELKKMTLQNWRRDIRRSDSLFEMYDTISKDVMMLCDVLIEEVDVLFTEITDKDSIDYARLQVLSLAQQVDVVSRYLRRSIRYAVISEISALSKKPINAFLSPAQIKFVENKGNRLEFLNAMLALSSFKVRDLPKILRKIPNAKPLASGETNDLHNARSLDPTGALNNFSMASVVSKPIYVIMMAVVDYQHSKYKLAQEELTALRIELDFLTTLIQTGQGDAALEHQAETAQERIDKLEYECARYEEKALGTNYG